ncbi:hypothetical protein I7I50_10902 [Histoplasma capsulatum G186AR]|uniref:Uncharacterized protein n=1 Tax=Ajellomyces capsulatus TaxID=5037 RepID=A0A8H7Z4F2_AJECA|nr:hypothetical protein I7I52_02140 [Histoplasma capsulatum]QSS69568.1 hypothetical protein I7I50_10902 [Histoplasma capsulatum G186AR]
MTVDMSDAEVITPNLQPDIAFFQAGIAMGISPSCCLGRSKSVMENRTATEGDRREYYQVFSRVNFIGNGRNARYGYFLTDAKSVLVPIKQLDGNGRRRLAQLIAWKMRGPGQMAVLPGLWYLGMLCAADNDRRLPWCPFNIWRQVNLFDFCPVDLVSF